MGQARLSERHLTLAVYLQGAEREGVAGEEMAGTGKTQTLASFGY